MSIADGSVLPNPGIPKTLGILNIIFGVILVLLGLCGIGSLIASPMIIDAVGDLSKKTKETIETRNKENEKKFDDRIAAEPDAEKKKVIEQEKATSVANQPVAPVTVDLSAATDVLKDPKIMAYSYAGAISGLVLHVVLLISGIGLIRLAPWGRTLGIWWSVLISIQVVLLLAASILIVLPANKPNSDKQVANMEKAAQGKPPGSPEASALQLTKMMAEMAVPIAVVQSLVGLIYPIILLVLLNSQGAKAACLGGKPSFPSEN